MQKLIAYVLVAAAALLMVGRASAEGPQIRINIPFGFTAGGSSLPSGEYRIGFDRSAIVSIESRDKGFTRLALGHAELVRPELGNECKLIFDQLGERYFLREARCNTAHLNFVMPPADREKHARQHEGAMNPVQQITLAMN